MYIRLGVDTESIIIVIVYMYTHAYTRQYKVLVHMAVCSQGNCGSLSLIMYCSMHTLILLFPYSFPVSFISRYVLYKLCTIIIFSQ